MRRLSAFFAAMAEAAYSSSPRSTRRVERKRSSRSFPFHAFHTVGLVPRISATVRM
jgi:hypothetical protein